MAHRQQLLNIITEAGGQPVAREEIGEKLEMSSAQFQTQLDRLVKQGIIEDTGDHKYVLTSQGKTQALDKEALELIDDEVELLSDEKLGATEFQQFLKLGRITGVVPPNLIIQTATHVWNGGDYNDLNWVGEAFKQMGIRRDLASRWWHSWRSFLNQPIPSTAPEFVIHASAEGKKEGEKEKSTGKRDYILSEEESPTYVGEGLGDLDYKDALDLAKLRMSRRKEVPQTASSAIDDVLKIATFVRSQEGEKAVGKSYVVKPSEDGYQVEEVEPNKPLVLPSPGASKPGLSYYVDSDGSVKELQPGQPVVIIKEPPKPTPTSGIHYLVDNKTGEVKEVAPGQPVVIIRESAPASQLTPIQVRDKDGNPMVLDLSTFIKLEEHRDKQRRDEESHQTKMEVAKEFKSLLKKASTAIAHTIEGKEGGEE